MARYAVKLKNKSGIGDGYIWYQSECFDKVKKVAEYAKLAFTDFDVIITQGTSQKEKK